MFGEKLKKLRLDKDITQQDLATILKVSSSTIGMYEQNRRSPDIETLKLIADYFKCSTDYLLGKKENKFNDIAKEDLIKESKEIYKLNKKDERDILKDVDKIMSKLDTKEAGPTYFNGAEMNEEDKELFKAALDLALKTIKVKNKETYTPKKYKKQK